MKRKFLAVVAMSALGLLCSTVARADELRFAISGNAYAEPLTCANSYCGSTLDLYWGGTIDVVLDGSGDGFYTGSQIESITFDTNWGSLVWDGGPTYNGLDPWITIQNGVATDFQIQTTVDGTGFEVYNAGGGQLGAAMIGACDGQCPVGNVSTFGGLGYVIELPEPSETALLLAALAMGGIVARARAPRVS